MEIAKKIHWVGIKDWQLRTFHGEELSTHRGSTYNSYLIKDEKTVLVDTAWDPYKEEFVANLEKMVGLENIDYVIVNHSEIDHSGSLALLMSKIPDTPVYCTQNGAKILKRHYHQDWNFRTVKTGDTLPIGEYELMFIEAPMLHWPDTMFTYVKGAGVLLSNDGFGQHYATEEYFNDQVNEGELYEEAIKYYANILTPFSKMVKQKIDQLKALNLPLNIIAPSHGVIWRKDPMQIVDKYYEWASDYQENMVTIIYDTMWGGTQKMAQAIAQGVEGAGVSCKLFNCAKTDHADMLTEVFKAKGVIMGSSTVNNGILSHVASMLEGIKGLKLKNKKGAAFGTYGWSGESPKILAQRLEESGFDIVQDGIKFQYNPNEEELQKCREFGSRFVSML